MAVPCCATTYLDRDQAGQLEMPLHHGKAAQEVFTLGAKVWEFPGQKYHPGKEGNKRNKELKVTLEQEKSSSVGVCLRANPLTHLRAPSGSAWFPPPPTRWGAVSDDRSTGLLSQSTTTSPSGQREAVHLNPEQALSCSGFIFFFLFTVEIQRREPHSAHLPTVQPYTVRAPVRRASVLSPTRRCNASLRLLCSGLRVELPSGTGRAPAEGPALG